MKIKQNIVLISTIILVTFSLRLFDLGKNSLWGDEGLSVARAESSWTDNLKGIIVLRGIHSINTIDNHPPLYFIILKIWMYLSGNSEFALRFFSVWISMLLIPLGWWIGQRMLKPNAAWILVVLFGLSPLYLWYSQEARMYPLLAFESLLLISLLLRNKKLAVTDVFLATIVMLAMFLTHYTSIFFLVLVAIWILIRILICRTNISIWKATLPFLSLAILLAVYFPVFIQKIEAPPELGPRFMPLHDLFTDVTRASGFGLSFPYLYPLTWPIQWVWAGVIITGAWKLWRQDRSLTILLFGSLIGTICIAYIVSFLKPFYHNIRQLFVITPVIYVLASVGIAYLYQRYRTIGILAFVLVAMGMLVSDWLYFSKHYSLKADWKGVLTSTGLLASKRDLIILQDLQMTPLVDYYYRGEAKLILTAREGGDQKDWVEALQRSLRPERVWLIVALSQEDLAKPNQYLFQWLSKNGLYREQQIFPSSNVWIRVLIYDFYDSGVIPSTQTWPVNASFGPYFSLRSIEGPELDGSLIKWWFLFDKGSESSINIWMNVQLVDETGTIWVNEVQPIWPAYPPDRWPTDQPVRYPVRLSMPPGLPPGIYRLRVEAFDLDRRIPINGAPAWESPPFPLEGYTRPAVRPAPRARSRAGLRLLDIRPEVAPPYFPGLGLPIRLLWEAEATPPAARTMALFWQQGATRRLLFRGDLGPPFFPPVQWQAGQVIAQRIVLPLPHDLRGYGQIRLVLYDAEGKELPWETLWPFHRTSQPVLALALSPWPVRRKPIGLAVRGQACFEDQICLDRYEITPGQAAPGETVKVRLSWHVLRRPERPGVVFVHLARLPEQPPLATGDAPPQGGRRPMLTWEPGEYVEDVHQLEIPRNLPAGRYRIFVGWYSEEGRWRAVDPSGTRYPMDAVPLGEIEVRP